MNKKDLQLKNYRVPKLTEKYAIRLKENTQFYYIFNIRILYLNIYLLIQDWHLLRPCLHHFLLNKMSCF